MDSPDWRQANWQANGLRHLARGLQRDCEEEAEERKCFARSLRPQK